MEKLAEAWNESAKKSSARVVLYRVEENAQDMLEAFFDYMLAVDTSIDDIAMQFHTPLNVIETFSKELVSELDEMVKLWNTADKKQDVPFDSIQWQADYTLQLQDAGRDAHLFVENLNRLVPSLEMPDDVLVTPILWLYNNSSIMVNDWLTKILSEEVHPQLKIIIADTYENQLFNNSLSRYGEDILLIEPDFNMPRIMEQIAAMGNPADPETQYRLNFIKLTNAIGAKKDEKVKEHSAACIQIALDNTERNPYWIAQIITVYYTLGVYKMGLKKVDSAVKYACKALDAAFSAKGKISDEMTFRNIGQAVMFRGSLYCYRKNWEMAMVDFQTAIDHYGACKDVIMQVEAFRMKGYAAEKNGMIQEEITYLVAGARLGAFISPAVAEASSYRLLLQKLLLTDYKKEIRPWELDDIVRPLLGEDWEQQIITSNRKSLQLQE